MPLCFASMFGIISFIFDAPVLSSLLGLSVIGSMFVAPVYSFCRLSGAENDGHELSLFGYTNEMMSTSVRQKDRVQFDVAKEKMSASSGALRE